jgi:hypothetical protein
VVLAKDLPSGSVFAVVEWTDAYEVLIWVKVDSDSCIEIGPPKWAGHRPDEPVRVGDSIAHEIDLVDLIFRGDLY